MGMTDERLGVRKGSHSCVNSWLLSSDWGFQTNLNWTNVHAINLTLVNVTSEDNGFTLTCIAENVVGMSNASVALTVYCKWTIKHISADLDQLFG